jgi:AraC-like DNA-binding protein
MPRRDHAAFHFVAEGAAWLRGAARIPLCLKPGDFVLIPHGRGHVLSDPRDGEAPLIDTLSFQKIGENGALLRHGGAGARTVLVCGGVRFEDPAANPLLDLMPEVLHIRSAADPHEQLFRQMLDAMGSEALAPRPGGATVMTRLADILVIHAIRSWLERSVEARTGWLGALRDPRIGRAVVLIHRQPESPWTVASLAGTVHMSRSVFSERFTALVGVPPLLYLTRWRMHLATRWLRDERASLAQVANRLGYESEPSFSRAFKRHIGVAPGAVRRKASLVLIPRLVRGHGLRAPALGNARRSRRSTDLLSTRASVGNATKRRG